MSKRATNFTTVPIDEAPTSNVNFSSHAYRPVVLVVDDEAPARRKILRLLRSEPGVQVVGEADSGESGGV